MVFDFNKIADDYDSWYESALGKMVDDFEKNLILPYLKMMPSTVVLEIGCGTGHWTSFLTNNNFYVLGIDNSEKMLEIANKKKIKNASFIFGDAHKLPFHANSIENIIAIASLEFMDNVEVVFNEIKRVLKPGGSFIAGCLNKNGSLIKEKINKSPYKEATFFDYLTLSDYLKEFGDPVFSGGAMFPENGKNLEEALKAELYSSEQEKLEHGNFLAAFVLKTKK
ncbi:MAG: class I SAM-dependent methyltransferase [Marinilabiliales bacterium]